MKSNNIEGLVSNTENCIKDELLKLNPAFEILKVNSRHDGNYSYTIQTQKDIKGHIYTYNRPLSYFEDFEDFVLNIESHYKYIEKLWAEYSDYCKTNEILQELRIFKFGDMTIELTEKLILPNTTSTGCGGGDYEIKRTPERVEKFLDNIEKSISIFGEAIVNLQKLKTEFFERIKK